MKFTVAALPALKDNYIYMLAQGEFCAAVDPGDAKPVLEYLARTGLRLTDILLTHHHQDHIGGASELVARLPGLHVRSSAYDRERIPWANLTAETAEELWDFEVRVLHIPGHTLGHIAYYFPSEAALFAGDTIFSAGCGRLFEGTPEMMHASFEKLRSLPTETRIFFGHEYTLRNLEFVVQNGAAPPNDVEAYMAECTAARAEGRPTTPSTIATEMRVNPFMRARTGDEFAAWRTRRDQF